MNDQTLEALAHLANFTTVAIAQLVFCLENAGAMEKGRYAAAIAATVNHPGAERDRPDYQHLSFLLRYLQDDFAVKQPQLHVIEGDKKSEDKGD